MAHSVSPETTVYVRGAGGGGGAAAARGVGASASAGGGGASSVWVFEAHAGPSNPYSTRFRSSCRSSRTSLAPLVSVCHTGLSEVYSTKLPSVCTPAEPTDPGCCVGHYSEHSNCLTAGRARNRSQARARRGS